MTEKVTTKKMNLRFVGNDSSGNKAIEAELRDISAGRGPIIELAEATATPEA